MMRLWKLPRNCKLTYLHKTNIHVKKESGNSFEVLKNQRENAG